MVTESNKNNINGMCLVAVGQLLYAISDVLVKSSLSKINLLQILFARFLLGTLFALVWWKWKQPSNAIHWYGDKPFIINIWIRGFFYYLMTASYYFGISYIPIGDASSIFYHAPLLIIFGAHFILKEPLGNIFILIISCIMVSCGIIVLSQPSFLLNIIGKTNNIDTLSTVGITSICISAISYCIACLLVRSAKDAHVVQVEMVNCVESSFIWIPITCVLNHFTVKNEIFGDIFTSQWVFDITSLLVLFLIGIIGFLALLCVVSGYIYGEATKVSWLEYIIIPTLFIFQTVIFDDPPNIYECIGGFMVTFGCLLPVFEEIYIYTHNYNNTIQYSHVYNESSADDSTYVFDE